MPGRQILDGVLIVNEVLDFAKRKRKRCLALKVYFQKAYDLVSRSYLDYMLVRLGFDGCVLSFR